MAQEGSTQLGVMLDILKAQKEKASGKSSDLSKALFQAFFTFFPGVNCIKMRFYTSAYIPAHSYSELLLMLSV